MRPRRAVSRAPGVRSTSAATPPIIRERRSCVEVDVLPYFQVTLTLHVLHSARQVRCFARCPHALLTSVLPRVLGCELSRSIQPINKVSQYQPRHTRYYCTDSNHSRSCEGNFSVFRGRSRRLLVRSARGPAGALNARAVRRKQRPREPRSRRAITVAITVIARAITRAITVIARNIRFCNSS